MGGDHLYNLDFPHLRVHFHLGRLGHEGIAGTEIPVFGEQRRRLLRWRNPGAAADNGKGVVRVLIRLQGIVQAHSPIGVPLDPDAAVRGNQIVDARLQSFGYEGKELPTYVIGRQERRVSRTHRGLPNRRFPHPEGRYPCPQR